MIDKRAQQKQPKGVNKIGNDRHQIVIIGGGFGGLYAAKKLVKSPVKITLVDKNNHHLFQPLLYQVATGGLSPGEIASPLRAVFKRQKNVEVVLGEAVDIDPDERKVSLRDDELNYDTLIIATGSSHNYFGHDQWERYAPGLKTIENALDIRRRIFLAFEAAEREPDPELRRAWMTFVVVGAGATGVELAGTLGELAHRTLRKDFRHIDPAETRILLLEGLDRLLPSYPPGLSKKAEKSLLQLGVTIQTNTLVTNVDDSEVTAMKENDRKEQSLCARTILWTAGVKASPMGKVLERRAGAELDKGGRVIVEPNLSVKGYPDIFVIGDLASFKHQSEQPLPALASVAKQQGKYVATLIKNRLKVRNTEAFRYKDRGTLAVIGRNAAVANFDVLRFDGFPAWVIWVFVHIAMLVEFDNKLLVMFQYALNYFTRKRGARLITGGNLFPLVKSKSLDEPRTKAEAESHA